MSKIKIAGAIASKGGVTLYLEDGQELILAKTSWQLQPVIDTVIPALARGEAFEIDLDDYSIERMIEKKTGGIVRFMKKAASKLFGLGGGDTLEPIKIAPVQTSPSYEPTPAPVESMVAVVRTPAGDVEIPGVQDALAPQIRYAIDNDSVGFTRFMERIAAMQKTRSHTVQELLNFMKRGDLPIADDGSIVAYKVLTSNNYDAKNPLPAGTYVDCHTHLVTQKLGSLVQMDEKLIDPNRRHECSTGLHIARRAYIRNFSGDIITIVKIAPEDVVAVPPGEPDKMRVARYHIVALVPAEAHEALRSNRSMTGNKDAATLLGNVIVGNHTEILEIVNIAGPKGKDVTVTPVSEAKPAPEIIADKTAEALDEKLPADVDVDIKAIRQTVTKNEELQLSAKTSANEEDDSDEEMRQLDEEAEAYENLVAEASAQPEPVDAVSEPEVVAEPAPEPQPEPVAQPAPAPAQAKSYDLEKVPEKWRAAFDAVASGQISQREAEKIHKISAKKLRALLREQGVI